MDLQNYKDLSTSEKILLVEEIWDSIAEDAITLTSENKKILDERLKSHNTTSKRTTWGQIKANVRKGKRK